MINRSNVRECFFQTVSNSSWANFGYLVAAEVEGADTLKELRMLFAAHGIGLIQLDSDNPAESQILVPAKERPEMDWDTANRLTTETKILWISLNWLGRSTKPVIHGRQTGIFNLHKLTCSYAA